MQWMNDLQTISLNLLLAAFHSLIHFILIPWINFINASVNIWIELIL